MKTQKLIVKHDFVMTHAKTTSKKQLAYFEPISKNKILMTYKSIVLNTDLL